MNNAEMKKFGSILKTSAQVSNYAEETLSTMAGFGGKIGKRERLTLTTTKVWK